MSEPREMCAIEVFVGSAFAAGQAPVRSLALTSLRHSWSYR